MLRSQPVHTSLRVGFGFGLASFLSILINELAFQDLLAPGNSILGNLMLYYFDLFETTNGQQIVYWIPGAISALLAGAILGIVFTVFVEDRSEYPRFILPVALSWYLHSAVASILLHSANLPFFLGSQHSIYLDVTLSILSYAFLGLMFVVVKSKTGKLLRFLMIAAVVYRLFAFVCVRLLLKFLIIETPWMFIALMAMIVVYLGSVIVVVLKHAGGRSAVWIIVAGVTIFRLMPYALSYILTNWLSLPELPNTLSVDHETNQRSPKTGVRAPKGPHPCFRVSFQLS